MKYYVIGWGYGEKLTPTMILMTQTAFDTIDDALDYAATCHQSYRTMVVKQVTKP